MPRLIGRDEELARITGLLDGRGALVVTGEPGSGKSHLLTVAADLARQRGHRVVVLHTPDDPLSLIRRMLMAVRHDLVELTGPDARAALAFLGLEAGSTADDPVCMTRVVLAELDRRCPVVVTADDVGLLTPAAAALLADLNGLVSALLLAGRVQAPFNGLATLALPPLGPQDSMRLLRTRPDPPTGRSRVDILRRAAGNPGALLELGDGTGPLRPAFAREIAALPEDTGRLLLHLAAAAAPVLTLPVTAAPADPRAVAAAAGVPETAWRAAEQAGLVVRDENTADFVHPVAAEVAYHAATAHQRARAHHRLAQHSPERRAVHLAAATFGADEQVAAEWETAAEEFRSRGQLVEAALAMNRAAERSSCPEAAARRLAAAAADAHRLDEPDWTAELNAAVRRLSVDPDLSASADFSAALALSRSGRQHDAYGVIAAARRAGLRTNLAMTRLVASIAAVSGNAEHRRGLAGMLAEVTSQIDPADVVLLRMISDPAGRAGRDLAESLEPPEPGDDRRTLAVTGTIAAFEDRSRRAVELLRAAMEHDAVPGRTEPALSARGETDTALGAVGETNPALLAALIDTGQWDLADRVTETIDASGLPVLRAALEAHRAHLQAARGHSAEAMRLVRAAWARIDVDQHRSIHVRLLRAAGLAATGAGDHDDAYRYLRSMFDREGRPLEPFLSDRGIAELVSAAVRTGLQDEVRPILEGVRATAGATPTVRLRLLLHRADALLADGPETETHFRRAVEDEAAEWPFELAVTQLHYGEWLRRARRPRDAREWLSSASATFAELGAVRLAEFADRELRATGPKARTGLLTPQEHQVAEFAARGLRNREIAEQLFISVRTVGAHLNSVYTKLGVNGRQHLPAALRPPQ